MQVPCDFSKSSPSAAGPQQSLLIHPTMSPHQAFSTLLVHNMPFTASTANHQNSFLLNTQLTEQAFINQGKRYKKYFFGIKLDEMTATFLIYLIKFCVAFLMISSFLFYHDWVCYLFFIHSPHLSNPQRFWILLQGVLSYRIIWKTPSSILARLSAVAKSQVSAPKRTFCTICRPVLSLAAIPRPILSSAISPRPSSQPLTIRSSLSRKSNQNLYALWIK